MRIIARENFQHAGNLSWPFDAVDPRYRLLPEGRLELDLRRCQFIQLPAALWCIVYGLLANLKGSRCVMLVPENMGVCNYLKSVGLFQILQSSGVDVDDRDIFGGLIVSWWYL